MAHGSIMDSSHKERTNVHEAGESLANKAKCNASSLQETDEAKPFKKPRSYTSHVWKYFSRVQIDGERKAKCHGCKALYAAGGAKGTSHLNRHIKTCKGLQKSHDIGVMMMDKEGKLRSRKIDAHRVGEILTMAVIEHDLPCSFVEYRWIKELVAYLNPDVRIMTRKTMAADVMKFYQHQKGNLKQKLKKSIGRICLTSNYWTSVTSERYICLTAHFVDEMWTLNSKILSFCKMTAPHSGIELSKKVHNCLKEWGIENKIFSITLDNASTNDNMQDLLKERLLMQDNFSLVCDGEFFHVRCCAHILNLIVQEGLKATSFALNKVRESIKYVKASEARMILFKRCVEQAGGIDTSMGLRLDVPTRWNSTYTMLESGLKYCRAFEYLALEDENYKFYLPHDEWNRAEAMCNFLRPFEKIRRLISRPSCPTLNFYFMQISKIEMLLAANMASLDPVIQDMSKRMKEKFDKYWHNHNVLLALAVVFDPRWKLNIIQYCYAKIDPITSYEKVANVKSKLNGIFNEYSNIGTSITNPKCESPATSSTSATHYSSHTTSVSTTTFHYAFDGYQDIYTIMDQSSMDKSELETYLEEPILKPDNWKDLDVLNWWKNNQERFPVLSKMAVDILSIPITTVANESAFNIGSRVLMKYRSSILSTNVQALICARNWLQGFTYKNNGCVDEEEEEEKKLDIFALDIEATPITSEAQSNVVDINYSDDEVENDHLAVAVI